MSKKKISNQPCREEKSSGATVRISTLRGPIRKLSFWLVLPFFVLVGLYFVRKTSEEDQSLKPPEASVVLGGNNESINRLGTQQSLMDLNSQQVMKKQQGVVDLLDPLQDGWDTEAFTERANTQLSLVSKLLTQTEEIEEQHFVDLIANDFRCDSLRPQSLKNVYDDGSIDVSRDGSESTKSSSAHSLIHIGKQGLREALEELNEGLQDASDFHVKFKLFRVTPGTQWIETTQYFQMGGRVQKGSIGRNSTWLCRWTKEIGGALPKLISIRVRDYEEVRFTGTSPTIFSDCTEAVLSNTPIFQQNLRYGTDYWIQRLEKRLGMNGFGHVGLAVGDVNNDGLPDIYLCQPGGLPNGLLIQQTDGSVYDAASSSGVDILDNSRSALLADFDNDGDQDLLVSLSDRILVHANNGQGQFEIVGSLATGTPGYSMAAADYDSDGNLDFYVCSQFLPMADITDLTIPVPYYDANNGGENTLFRNEGGMAFRNVTTEVGMDENNKRFSFAASWEDYDNDGDPDLYVANDFGRNNLYRNDDGQFTDVAASAGVEDIASGMSVSWSDANHDGLMDIYVSNMFSAAGGRITFQKKYRTTVREEALPKIQRLARGNSLFLNNGDGTFRDASIEAGVTMGRWAWSSLFVDINNDSWDDLVVSNGFMTKGNTGDL